MDKESVHIYTLEYYSVVKKQWHLEFCVQMNEIRKHYPEVTQTQKDEYGMYSLISEY